MRFSHKPSSDSVRRGETRRINWMSKEEEKKEALKKITPKNFNTKFRNRYFEWVDTARGRKSESNSDLGFKQHTKEAL